MITVDASVWMAFFDTEDVFHADSVGFLRACEERGVRLCAPNFAVVETGCALARRRRDSARGLAAAKELMEVPALRLEEINTELNAACLEVGTSCFLRGADAIYTATAQITGTRLVTWDKELIERAGGITPKDWLSRQT